MTYSRLSVLLHWLMALLIVAAFGLGFIMTDIPGITPTKLKYFSWHKWVGVSVLFLAAIRLLWRLKHPAPPYRQLMPRWQIFISGLAHGAMYVLMFAVPLSGYFYSLAAGVPVVYFGVLSLPVLIEADPILKPVLKELHEALMFVFLAVIILHILAVIKHQIFDKDNILKRMLP
jgi:cytochrome b561